MLRVVLPKFTFSSLVNLKINEENKAAYITLVNPKKRNTLSLATLTEINDALGKVEQSVSEKKTKVNNKNNYRYWFWVEKDLSLAPVMILKNLKILGILRRFLICVPKLCSELGNFRLLPLQQSMG